MTHLSVGHTLFFISSLLWLVAFLAGWASEQWPHLLWLRQVPVALFVLTGVFTLAAAWGYTLVEIIQ